MIARLQKLNSLDLSFRFRRVLRGILTFLCQFNHLLNEEVQPFEAYVLLTLHPAEDSRALTVEIAESVEFDRYRLLGLITNVSAKPFQQLSVL